MINYIRNFFRPRSVDGIVAAIQRQVDNLFYVSQLKEQESDDITAQLVDLRVRRDAVEADRARSVRVAFALKELIK